MARPPSPQRALRSDAPDVEIGGATGRRRPGGRGHHASPARALLTASRHRAVQPARSQRYPGGAAAANRARRPARAPATSSADSARPAAPAARALSAQLLVRARRRSMSSRSTSSVAAGGRREAGTRRGRRTRAGSSGTAARRAAGAGGAAAPRDSAAGGSGLRPGGALVRHLTSSRGRPGIPAGTGGPRRRRRPCNGATRGERTRPSGSPARRPDARRAAKGRGAGAGRQRVHLAGSTGGGAAVPGRTSPTVCTPRSSTASTARSAVMRQPRRPAAGSGCAVLSGGRSQARDERQQRVPPPCGRLEATTGSARGGCTDRELSVRGTPVRRLLRSGARTRPSAAVSSMVGDAMWRRRRRGNLPPWAWTAPVSPSHR
jgi:hypothetical protein